MNGLNSHEVRYRVNNNMINNKNIKNSRSVKSILLSNTLTLFNILHIVLFVLVISTGKFRNALFIGTIFFNTFISIYQEIKAKGIIDKLVITNTSRVKVIRDGKTNEILPTEIVLDDLLYLKQGDCLIVDAVIIKSNGCEVDESIITGESVSVLKKQGDKLISGTIISCGSAYAKVVSINDDTYTNGLIKEATTFIDNSSYLKKTMDIILKIVTFLIIPVALLLFITQFFYSGQNYSESILSSVAGVVGMVPDGLVLLTSISLTVGVIKMASKKVIIQKLNGIELLACVDMLCLDKTGTITDGTMDVVEVIRVDKKIDIDTLIPNMLVDNFNATDNALLKYFGKKSNLEIINYIPFSSVRKYSLIEFKNGIFAMGALEYLTNDEYDDYKELNMYIDKGYRVITLVKCKNKFDKDTNKIIAFIIIKDNVRKNAKETLDYFKAQNVNIKIISGDNPVTVYNIFKQLSIDGYDNYISGPDIPDDDNKLKEIVNNYTIFGRITPYQKKLIIKALKENNTVGMIGDGVNDILALKEADCSIALASGSSAARSVSSVILTDADFGVLPSIVNEGRRVINNIERVASMYLIKTVYSFLISLLCIFLSYKYPFYPIQLTLISVICVGIPSFFLALEPNYNKVSKGFLLKVFRNALSSGLCVFIDVLLLIILSTIFNFSFDNFRIVLVSVTGYLNLRLLYKISLPLSFLKKILLSMCTLSFYLLLFLFSEFFLISSYNILSFILILLFIFINNYIVCFFQEIYDKIVLWIIKKKRKRIVSEIK